MAQEEFRTVLHHILRVPFVYNAVQNLVGTANVKRKVIEIAFSDRMPRSFLDLGCGTGEIIGFIPQELLTGYTGLDINGEYIAHARQRLPPPRYRFVQAGIETAAAHFAGERFDLIYLGGFLHHLNDEQCRSLLSLIPSFLSDRGRLVVMDPIYSHGQGWLAARLTSMDRGKYVRREDDYLLLLQRSFVHVKPHIFHDLIHYPHSTQITVCRPG
ncbi:MAG TPA: class I SAM-dependent methyltransferase [Chthoniobacteraceae bacterium]|nr:class I SAM-dependent methyltransferase [Opitutaceae bacterium]HWB59887.1 class I SAM-dependent methyltransferase [Chthoniobacteraceae bacterium]